MLLVAGPGSAAAGYLPAKSFIGYVKGNLSPDGKCMRKKDEEMKYDVIVVGAGMAGLTAAAYLCRDGRSVLLCEKGDRAGGLVGTFNYKGFTFDAGIRAFENSGVLFPMLRQLGLDVDFIKSPVSIGIGDKNVSLVSKESLEPYREMLANLFPGEKEGLQAFAELMKRSMEYMDVLYGIDNPLFLDVMKDPVYMRETLLPWMFRYISKIGNVKRFKMPVEECLRPILHDQALIDIIAQHFFKKTPASFALSYFSLYLDYCYPRGGTGTLVAALEEYVRAHGGHIRFSSEIREVDTARKTVEDQSGTQDQYDRLIWCADQNALYRSLTGTRALPARARKAITARSELLKGKEGGDSVLTLYLMVNQDKASFASIHDPHFFYTPKIVGLSTLSQKRIRCGDGYSAEKGDILGFIREYLALTTYEISIPALRDPDLAPEGKTGLIISTLMDHSLVSHIREQGWYEEFKALCRQVIVDVLSASIYPGLQDKVEDGFVSTPLTIAERTGNTGGAITGWAFTNAQMPAVSSMPGIAASVKTPIPGVLQAGQWTFSPSGLPVSILTGKLAADRAIKELRRESRQR